jgi:hypothetical protein
MIGAPHDGRRTGVVARLLVILGLVAVLSAGLSDLAVAGPVQETSKTAAATLDDTTLTQGQVVNIDGAGWLPRTQVELTLHPGKHQVRVQAGVDGRFRGGLDIPGDAVTGDYGITVAGFGGDGLYAYLQNKVTISSPRPVATLSNTRLGQGEIVTVQGEHWKPGGEVEVTLHPGKHQVKAIAGPDRRFTAELDIPIDAVTGGYGITVAGTGSDGLGAYLPNNVTISSPSARAALDDTTLTQGQVVTITGRRWKPGQEVQLTLHPGKHQVKVVPGPDGRFTGRLDIPEDTASGRYGITVAGVGADGIYAYLQNDVTVGDAGFAERTAITGGFARVEPLRRDIRPVTLPTVPETDDGPSTGTSLMVVVLMLLAALVTIAALIASSRPGVQRAWRHQRDRLRARLGFGR